MIWLFGILLFIFVLICVFLCLVILIQSDKGGGISGTLGGGFASAANLIGSTDTANILTKATSIAGGIFFGLCLILSIFFSHPTEKQVKSSLKARAEKMGSYSPSSVLSGSQGLPLGNQEGNNQPAPQGLPNQQLPQGIPIQPEQTPSSPVPQDKGK
jgi:preprotein translocase subunit SecG